MPQTSNTLVKMLMPYGPTYACSLTHVSYRTAQNVARQMEGTLGIIKAWLDPDDPDRPEQGGRVMVLELVPEMEVKS